MGDLEGITVVTVEQAVAAPYASGRLADAGARVIKVERPEGDFARRYDTLVRGESAYFVWLNRGKQSICLDLKQDADRGLLRSMVSRADVFIQNLAPGAAARLGFGAEALRQADPRLIVCSISGYGEVGPYRDQKAYDLLIQAESGLCAINGTPEGPARVGVSVCDIAAGMSAHAAILQGLFARERSGEGRAIEVSLYHAMADWMNVPYLQTRYGGRPPGRQGLQHPSIAPYGAYACADGKQLLISIQNERGVAAPVRGCDRRRRSRAGSAVRDQQPACGAPRCARADRRRGVRVQRSRGQHRDAGRRRDRLRAPLRPRRPDGAPAEPMDQHHDRRRRDRAPVARSGGRGTHRALRRGP